MTTINRNAIVVRPSQPFLDWLHRVDPTSNELRLEDLGREPTVYLLPECGNQEEARAYVEEVCGLIFEEQLGGWYRVPSSWPSRRDLDAFDRWFEWSFHSMVVDLSNKSVSPRGDLNRTGSFLAGVGASLSFWTLRD